MRTSWIAIATALLGCLIGLGLTSYESITVGDRFEPSFDDHDPDSEDETPVITGKAIVVGESVFDFGALEKNRSGKCKFTLRNESVAPLSVVLEGVSCGLCIQTEFSDAEIASGDELAIEVNYTTHKDGPEFAEYVEVKTSDPENRVIRFNITGYVTKLIRLSKSQIEFGSISAGEDASANFRIFGFFDAPIEVTQHEFSGNLPPEFFKFEATPLEYSDFKDDDPRAKTAIQVHLSMASGTPLGPINENLSFVVQIGDKATEVELAVRGTVVSDIMLIGGRDFNDERNLVRFGTFPSAVGHSTTLRIRVRGPYRDDVTLKVGEIEPADHLTATLGEPTKLQSGYLYPLHISVPAGTPPMTRLGSQQSKVGVITIETTHPSAKQVPVYVSFVVE